MTWRRVILTLIEFVACLFMAYGIREDNTSSAIVGAFLLWWMDQ